jgi:threonine synthase
MHYTSTRDPGLDASLETALRTGIAPDGGLYVPASLPRFDPERMNRAASLAECGRELLAPFFDGSTLAAALDPVCREAFDIPLPIVELDPAARILSLELWHGPTAAFKDFAARFLAGCMARLRRQDDPPRTVLVATSGDTGAAVAAAFHRRPGFRVVILYPDGRVSTRQAHQLGAFGDNVRAFRVQGDFDDCQRMVKVLLSDPEASARHGLTSANSISIGRLLPQIAYYAHAALQLGDSGSANGSSPATFDVVVPTGNLGNALACVLAREMGFAIGTIYLATNANRTLPDYFDGRAYRGRPGLQTLANAMDVGDPSNFERLAWLFRERELRDAGIEARAFDDARIRNGIRTAFEDYRKPLCPHSACALEYARDLRAAGHDRPLLLVETAHAAKFETVVEPLIGQTVPVPPALATLLQRPSHAEEMAPNPAALGAALEAMLEH